MSHLKIDLQQLSDELPELDVEAIRAGQRVELTLVRQIWHKVEELTEDPLLGYRLGVDISLKGLGVLTPILMHSPTPRVSLENIIQYTPLLSDSVRLRLEERDGYLVFWGMPVSSSIKENPHHVVSILISLISMSRIMGVTSNALEKLCVPAALDTSLLEEKIQRRVEGTQEPPYAIWFSCDTLDDPIPGADNHLYQINKAYAEDLILQKKAGDDLVESVKSLIIEQGYQKAGAENVASQLSLSKRGLQRLLAEEKTTFRSLKEDVIKERALRLMVQRDCSVETISKQLGYSEVSAFHRAFKGWFGVTPKDYASNPVFSRT